MKFVWHFLLWPVVVGWGLGLCFGRAAAADALALTNIQQILELGRDRSRMPAAFAKVRGVITFPSIDVRTRIYVQDGVSGIRVNAARLDFKPEPGQLVEVMGMVLPGDLYPYISGAEIRRVGRAALPEPIHATASQLAAGLYFGHRVSVTAVVRDVRYNRERIQLLCTAEGRRFVAGVGFPPGQPLPDDWVDAQLELRGNTWVNYDSDRRPLGFSLAVHDTNQVTVLRPGVKDPFTLPRITTRDLRLEAFEPDRLLRVAGVVSFVLQDGWISLRDETGAVVARRLVSRLSSTAVAAGAIAAGESEDSLAHEGSLNVEGAVAAGDRIELVGIPTRGEWHSPRLLEADVRIVSHGDPPQPVDTTCQELRRGMHDADLVRVTGRVVDIDTDPASPGKRRRRTAWLESGGCVIETQWDEAPGAAAVLAKESVIQVTGVPFGDRGEMHPIRSIRLRTRDGGDIRVLRAGPSRLLFGGWKALGVAAVATSIALGWVWLLRRQVARQTAALRSANESLRDSEERFSKAFRASSARLAILDAETGCYLDVNDSFVEAYGYSREEVLGRTAMDLRLWETLEDGDAARRACERDGRLRSLESRLRTKSGELRTVLQSGDFIHVGSRRCILSVGIDITDRKQAETETQKALASARELGELKSQFISMVSHEFRTPLGVIQSASDILDRYLDRLSPEKRRRHVDMILRSTRSLAQLVDGVLLLGKVEDGRMPFTPVAVDLAAVCASILDEVNSATSRRCPIQIEVAPGLAGAQSDVDLLRHIFANLLENAVKYSAPGDPVAFRVERIDDDAVFSVVDHGIGIPEADQANLFQSFSRGGNVGATPGTGLGLVVVQRCVERHRGEIQIQSKPGDGTTVTVKLPVFAARHAALLGIAPLVSTPP